jgi:hypothetical protein
VATRHTQCATAARPGSARPAVARRPDARGAASPQTDPRALRRPETPSIDPSTRTWRTPGRWEIRWCLEPPQALQAPNLSHAPMRSATDLTPESLALRSKQQSAPPPPEADAPATPTGQPLRGPPIGCGSRGMPRPCPRAG